MDDKLTISTFQLFKMFPDQDAARHGAKKADDLVLGANVNEIRLAPKEGGTVEVTMRAQTLPEPGMIARVVEFLGRSAKVSVVPDDSPDEAPLE